jgi:hypothetical protein
MCLLPAGGPADETNVTLTITNTSIEFTQLGRCVFAIMLCCSCSLWMWLQ